MPTEIKAYSKIEAGIADLAAKYSHEPDCSTKAGFEQCKKDYRAIRKVETALEKERTVQGEAARKHVALVNSEAKLIDAKIKEISAPFKDARDCRQEEIDLAEEKRIADIKQRIQQLTDFVAEAHNSTSESVSGIIEAVDMIDCSEGFDELTADALKAKKDTLEQLGQILQQKIQAENAEAERVAAEEAKRLAEQAQADAQRLAEQVQLENEHKSRIEKRINVLRMIPMDFISNSAAEISAKIDSLMGFVPPAEQFGDRHQEALDAQSQVISQLQTMLYSAMRLEAVPEPAPEPVAVVAQPEFRAAQEAMNYDYKEMVDDVQINTEPMFTAPTKAASDPRVFQPMELGAAQCSDEVVIDALISIYGVGQVRRILKDENGNGYNIKVAVYRESLEREGVSDES